MTRYNVLVPSSRVRQQQQQEQPHGSARRWRLLWPVTVLLLFQSAFGRATTTTITTSAFGHHPRLFVLHPSSRNNKHQATSPLANVPKRTITRTTTTTTTTTTGRSFRPRLTKEDPHNHDDDDADDDDDSRHKRQPKISRPPVPPLMVHSTRAPPPTAPLPPPPRQQQRRNVLHHGVAAVLSLAMTSGGGWASLHHTPAAFAAAAATTTTTTSLEEVCANGSLQLEQAVPGAYEQACMQLPVRTVPLDVRVHAASSSQKHSSKQPTTRMERTVLELEQGASGAGTTGLAVWNSSLLMVRLLQALQHRDVDCFVRQSCIVEVGCGTGLVSLAVSRLGAPWVIATDSNPTVVELAQRNVQRNRIRAAKPPPPDHSNGSSPSGPDPSVVEVSQLSWGALSAVDYAERASLMVGSDLTYNAGSWRALAETWDTMLHPTGSVLYVTLGHDGLTPTAELSGFLAVARACGLVPVTPADVTWPFATSTNDKKASSSSLLQVLAPTLSPSEQALIQSTGGIGIVVLQKTAHVNRGRNSTTGVAGMS